MTNEPATELNCLRRGSSGTCLQSLAGGWITCTDLCATCTTRFITALEWVTGDDECLSWHAAYVERTKDGQR